MGGAVGWFISYAGKSAIGGCYKRQLLVEFLFINFFFDAAGDCGWCSGWWGGRSHQFE